MILQCTCGVFTKTGCSVSSCGHFLAHLSGHSKPLNTWQQYSIVLHKAAHPLLLPFLNEMNFCLGRDVASGWLKCQTVSSSKVTLQSWVHFPFLSQVHWCPQATIRSMSWFYIASIKHVYIISTYEATIENGLIGCFIWFLIFMIICHGRWVSTSNWFDFFEVKRKEMTWC